MHPVPRAELDLADLYAAHRLALVRLATILVDDTATAEDLVQDAYIALARHAATLRDEGAAAAYLRTSVLNGARSHLRRRRTVRTFLARARQPEDAEPPDQHLVREDSGREVLAAVRRLPPRMQEVLALRYWSELSEAQIARTLGISEGTVKSTASRALDRLEVLLGGTR